MEITLQDYSIHIGELNHVLIDYFEAHQVSQVFVIVDENTKEHCLPLLGFEGMPKFQLITIKAGEQHKNISTCTKIWDRLIETGADRKAIVINLGGGVIGDMGGFTAASYKRGIRFIQIPTTLLSQVDASVGGKLGIDYNEVKNAVGLFKNPEAVLIQPTFLQTLSYRELRSGFAEVIKHALIADADQWKRLLGVKDLIAIDYKDLIHHSVSIKKQIVEEDPFEYGIRKKLNFGHTIGHAIESFYLNAEQPLLHGEAIAWGMAAESYLSIQQTGLNEADFNEIFNYLHDLYQLKPIPSTGFQELLNVMKNDKKNSFGKINFTTLKSPGISLVNQEISPSDISNAILAINTRLS